MTDNTPVTPLISRLQEGSGTDPTLWRWPARIRLVI